MSRRKEKEKPCSSNLFHLESDGKESMSLTGCLNKIMLIIKEMSFNGMAENRLRDELDYVGEKLNICPEEAAMLACVLENSIGSTSCEEEEIADFLGCTNIQFINCRKYLQSLAEKRIIRVIKSRYGDNSYAVRKEAVQAIIDDKEFSEKSFSGLNADEMFSYIRFLFKDFKEEVINEKMLLDDLNMLVNNNMQNHFCKMVVEYGVQSMNYTEQRIFYYLCNRYVSFGEMQVDLSNLKFLISERDDNQKFVRRFQSEKTECQKDGLICFGGDDGLVDKSIVSLSDEVKNVFFNGIDLICEGNLEGNKDLMRCEDIVAKELFYNVSEQKQVTRLERLLEDKSFSDIQMRLEEMGMRKGFNIIIYGGPGTGKTETTMQLAKKTGRDVFFIDMSRLKSKWVGDSEKTVKGVFNTYRQLCKIKSVKPILFFNEADAIFGKRFENVDTAVAQMLNSIQNIILQEMENIDGIMICTTNLHSNLDPAFERRFLYKIELGNPKEEVRAKIWKSMLRTLNDEQCQILAHKYDFSGGQIENVTRKSTVEYILTGTKTSLEMVCRFCDEEIFNTNTRKIGF